MGVRMIYLSGAVRQNLPPELGLMLTPNMGNAPDLTETWWGADTGCFTKSEDFNLDTYLRYLVGKQKYAETCLFATAPDVVGNAEATWERSRSVLPMIRSLGFPAALVAQDGLEDTEIPWGKFDVLFIGGTTTWKLSGAVSRIVAEAKRRGVWVHMGRVNSERRLRAAVLMGCDSVDGTYVAHRARGGHGDRGVTEIVGWFRSIKRTPFLPLGSKT